MSAKQVAPLKFSPLFLTSAVFVICALVVVVLNANFADNDHDVSFLEVSAYLSRSHGNINV